ncbi:MAG TPA: hypothetical protein VGL38_10160 [bacterium]|jgi:anti-sigma28 factor (negative regulator of flagellin synthesis)
MKVNDLHGAIRGLDPRELQKTERPPEKPEAANHQSTDGDSLDVSLSAHVSARSSENMDASQEASALSPARVQEIRDRIQSGFYNSPAVIGDTADKLLSFYSR